VEGVKLAGQEERYSRLDLVDAAASVAGAQQAYLVLRTIVINSDPELIAKVDTRFATLQQDLAVYGSGVSLKSYDKLSKAEIKVLTSDVDALLGPMAQVVGAVAKA
jgi:iron uptake system component EfeO